MVAELVAVTQLIAITQLVTTTQLVAITQTDPAGPSATAGWAARAEWPVASDAIRPTAGRTAGLRPTTPRLPGGGPLVSEWPPRCVAAGVAGLESPLRPRGAFTRTEILRDRPSASSLPRRGR